MKNIVFLVLVLCSVSQAHIICDIFGDLSQYKDACASELGIEVTNPPPPADGATRPPRQEPSHDMKCLINCMARRAGIFNSNGVLQTSRVNLPSSATNVDLTRCTTITNSDPCEQAYLVETCIADQLPRPQQ